MIKKAIEDMENFFFEGVGIACHENVGKGFTQAKQGMLFDIMPESLVHESQLEYHQTEEDICRMIFKDYEFRNLLENSLDTEIRVLPWGIIAGFEEPFELKLRRLILSPTFLSKKTIEKDIVGTLPSGRKINIPKGMKVSKALKFVISDKVALEEVQTRFSTFQNSAKIHAKLGISIHPLDYLTVSVNKSSWSSCFNVLENGEYQASVLSLLNSPNTMVAYLKRDEDVMYEDVGMKWNNKRWRTLITLSEDLNICHIGKQYPYDLNAECIKLILAEVGKLTGKKYTLYDDSQDRNLHILAEDPFYNDCHRSTSGHFLVGIAEDVKMNQDNTAIDDVRFITINPQGAYCISCGLEHNGNPSNLMCSTCSGDIECDCCGYMGDSDYFYDTGDGDVVCDSCWDYSYSSCNKCNDSFHENTLIIGLDDEYYCESCYKEIEEKQESNE